MVPEPSGPVSETDHGDPPPPPPAGRRLLVLGLCFLLSGAASLMDQVVWLRYLSLSFGNTTWAAATLLAVFMGGLGFGALLVGRWTDRLSRPLVAYALFEIGIAVFALASPRLVDVIDLAYVALYREWGSHPLLFAGGRALLAALFLGPPTLLMGGTLPLVLRDATPSLTRLGRTSGVLYGANTLGAVAGTALAGFVTVRLVGLWGTLLVAAAANLVAALGAIAVSRPRPAAIPVPFRRPPTRALLVLFLAMGATSLAYEVLWTRILVFFLGSSVYAYSLMLVLVLFGIGLGSVAAAPWADRVASPLVALGLVELGIAAWIPLQILLFGRLNELLVAAARFVGASSFEGVALAQLLAVAPLLLPPTLLMGASFPLALRSFATDPTAIGADTGAVYGTNTVGAVTGALAAGFVLIPLVGTQNALLVTGVVNALLGIVLLRSRPIFLAAASGVPALLAAASIFVPPTHVILSAGMFRSDEPEDLVYFHEDAQASVTIRRLEARSGDYLSLELNGVNVAGTSPDLFAIQKLQGHLPLLLSSGAESVVHIGFGSGGTAWAVSRHPVDDILVVEISPEVLAASDRFFGEINHGVLSDPRVRTEINDGRNFLLASPERFDAALSDSIHPRYAGNGSLYSLEYFRLLGDRLEPGGVASMWLPMYSLTPRNFAMILSAFREVFPSMAVWYEPSALNSFTVVTGKKEPPAWDLGSVRATLEIPAVAAELADLGIRGPADVIALLLATGEDLAPWLDEVPPHVDDLPAVEYESGSLLSRDRPWLATFTRLLAARPGEPPDGYLAGLGPGERRRARIEWATRSELLEAHRASLEAQIRER